MKILILGSVALPVPPPKQGGTERIAYHQAIGLAKRGHDITLVAAKGSKEDPSYRLVEIGGDTIHPVEGIVESSRNLRKEMIYMAGVVDFLLEHGSEFDVILNNMRGGESLLLPIAKKLDKHFVTVMHLPLFPELADLFHAYNTPVVTISNAQRQGFPDVRYVGTVYNCVEPELSALSLGRAEGISVPDAYYLVMGSIAPHKNQRDAILAAKKMGKRLVIAGKIGNQAYYDREIKHFVDGAHIEIRGEMGLREKAALLTDADALLFPILWPEPFGLVMIEAMACGTPVIAYRNGAVPEVVVDGKTGFIVEGVDGLVDGVRRIGSINRAACRRHVEEHFTVEKMIDSLERVLQNIRP